MARGDRERRTGRPAPRRGSTARPTPEPQHGLRRLPTLLLVGALAVGGLLLRDDGSEPVAAASPELLKAGQLAPLAPAAEALSTAWYCPGGTALPGDRADATLVLANTSAETKATGQVTVYASGEGAPPNPASVLVDMAPGSIMRVRLGDVVTAPYAAALVETTGGRLTVEQEVVGPSGRDVGRCGTRPSSTWYFPYGQTTAEATLQIALFNPFPGNAVVDITFVDDEDGFRAPVAFGGVLVPAQKLVVVDIAPVVTRRARVSTRIEARSGRIVAQRLQTVPGADGSVAVDIGLGAPGGAPAWFFADGRADAAGVERFVIFNPGEASLDAEVILLSGSGQAPARVRVPAGGAAEYVVNRDPRVMLPVMHGTLVQTLAGQPIVVERVLASGVYAAQAVPASVAAVAPPDTTAPAAGIPPPPPATPLPAVAPGLSASLGSPVVATRWTLAAAAVLAPGVTQVSVLNPGDAPVAVTVRAIAGSAGTTVGEGSVLPGRRLVVDVPADQAGNALVVEAAAPVVVSRLQSNASPLALASEPAVADSGGALVAEPTAGFDEGASETPPGTGVTAPPTTSSSLPPTTAPPAPPPTVGTTAAPPPTAAPETTAPPDPTTESTAAPE